MDGPSAQGFLSLTGPSAPRVVVAASPRIIKSALRDWLSISYGMINILRLARCARLPLSGFVGLPPVQQCYLVKEQAEEDQQN